MNSLAIINWFLYEIVMVSINQPRSYERKYAVTIFSLFLSLCFSLSLSLFLSLCFSLSLCLSISLLLSLFVSPLFFLTFHKSRISILRSYSPFTVDFPGAYPMLSSTCSPLLTLRGPVLLSGIKISPLNSFTHRASYAQRIRDTYSTHKTCGRIYQVSD